MAIGAGHVHLATLGIELLLAFLVDGLGAWIARDLDIDDLPARGVLHVGRDVGQITDLPFQRLLTVGLTAGIDGRFQGDDLAGLGIEERITVCNTDTAVLETAAVGLAIGERLVEQRLALFDVQFVGREFLDFFPLAA